MSAHVLPLLAPVTGRMVLCGASDGPASIAASEVMVRNVSLIGYAAATLPPDRRGLLDAEVLTLAATGQLQSVIGSVLPLEQAAEAHRAIENRETVGKTIPTP